MRPTLTQVVTAALGLLALALAGLFLIVSTFSRTTILANAERSRAQTAREVEMRVTHFLSQAPEIAQSFQALIANRALDLRDPRAVESTLLALLVASADVAEVSLTTARGETFDAEGLRVLAAPDRAQWSVERREGAAGAEIMSRHVFESGGGFIAERRDFSTATTSPARLAPETGVEDPTTHPTFSTPASRDFAGEMLWSDLHWSQLDDALPDEQRRVEVSVQQSIVDETGQFAGVVRVGLFAQQLDAAMRRSDPADPHRVFLRDAAGRLITRLRPSDRIREMDGDLRVEAASVPRDLQAALDQPVENSRAPRMQSFTVSVDGNPFLATLLPLRGTQQWWVCVVVPRAYYLGRLQAMRDRLLLIFIITAAVVVIGGTLVLREVRRAHRRLASETARMNRFEFTPSPASSVFADVGEVLEGMERAKAALRALGKYAPVDLARRLFREKQEPVLGGEPHEISIMFTDIRGFTTLSERTPPATLARALGLYLDAMVRIIQHDCGGTIDKFIGDAIMTLWNVPEPAADHARLACRAAWRCQRAVREVAASPEWPGLPSFETRFGLHAGTALVGHFGATERMNYTAVGDAVNLASRLEKLNKLYGTSIIVSAAIAVKARAEFAFRLLDRVAVRGKSEAVEIYELLGPIEQPFVASGIVANYETALAAYTAADFSRAAILLAPQAADDPPSAQLFERCRRFIATPPPGDWSAVHLAD